MNSGTSFFSFKNKLLLAAPQIRSSIFQRSIIYIVSHSASKGAEGLILNHPTGQVLSDFIESKQHSKIKNLPVYYGGPVSEEFVFIVRFKSKGNGQLSIHDQLTLDEIDENTWDPSLVIKAFKGLSAWSKGQLEMEMAQQIWLQIPEPQDFIHQSFKLESWYELMKQSSPLNHILSYMPERAFLN